MRVAVTLVLGLLAAPPRAGADPVRLEGAVTAGAALEDIGDDGYGPGLGPYIEGELGARVDHRVSLTGFAGYATWTYSCDEYDSCRNETWRFQLVDLGARATAHFGSFVIGGGGGVEIEREFTWSSNPFIEAHLGYASQRRGAGFRFLASLGDTLAGDSASNGHIVWMKLAVGVGF